MRDVPASLTATWNEGLFIGDRRPIARVTVQHPRMYLRNFSLLTTFTENVTTNKSNGAGSGTDDTIITCDCDCNGDPLQSVTIDLHKGHKVSQTYADFLFTGGDHELPAVTTAFVALYNGIPDITPQILANTAFVSVKMVKAVLGGYLPGLVTILRMVKVLSGNNSATLANFRKLYKDKTGLETPLELPNVASLAWERSIGQDAADCTLTVWNTKPLEIGETPIEGDLDLPGYYTYSRGGSNFSSQWGHTRNPWFGMLVPDNLLRTYEGYGFDASKCPEKDPHLVQTGVWMIDSVDYNTDGTITIKARDLARLLLEQQYYAPVVPDDFYDLDWSNWTGDFPIPGPAGGVKLKVSAEKTSNNPWIPSPNDRYAGHRMQDAFDGDPSTYWLSVGNVAPSKRYAYEFVQAKVNNQSVDRVRFRTKKKGYSYYVSVKVGGVWQGGDTIKYFEDGIGKNDSDVPYVATGNVDSESFIDVKLPKTYKKVQSVRIALANLQNFRIGTYQYRGAFRDVEVYGPAGVSKKKDHYTKGPVGSNPGHYEDYTDLVKLVCAWAGFFWPDGATQRFSDGTFHDAGPASFDTAVLGKGVKGRVWGDFQASGTNGPTSLDRSTFDKRPLMDFINAIRDTLGFIFFIDESGGVQWRQPNVHNFGMWRTVLSPKPRYLRGQAHDIHEDKVLLSLGSTVDSKNVRESFYVGDLNGKVSAFAPGFNPNPTGLRRISGWTDANYAPETDKNGNSTRKQLQDAITQCQVMADMISLRQLFTYRVDRVRIPANPAIQVDDQVKITERISEEAYVHYVNGISSNLDMSSGEWTYDLATYWLGQSPETKWLYNPHSLDDSTQDYIATLNKYALNANDAKNLEYAARVIKAADKNRGD